MLQRMKGRFGIQRIAGIGISLLVAGALAGATIFDQWLRAEFKTYLWNADAIYDILKFAFGCSILLIIISNICYLFLCWRTVKQKQKFDAILPVEEMLRQSWLAKYHRVRQQSFPMLMLEYIVRFYILFLVIAHIGIEQDARLKDIIDNRNFYELLGLLNEIQAIALALLFVLEAGWHMKTATAIALTCFSQARTRQATFFILTGVVLFQAICAVCILLITDRLQIVYPGEAGYRYFYFVRNITMIIVMGLLNYTVSRKLRRRAYIEAFAQTNQG